MGVVLTNVNGAALKGAGDGEMELTVWAGLLSGEEAYLKETFTLQAMPVTQGPHPSLARSPLVAKTVCWAMISDMTAGSCRTRM